MAAVITLTTDFGLKRGGETLPGTIRRLTNTVRWSGDDVSLWVKTFKGTAKKLKFKDAGAGREVRAAVYSMVSTRDSSAFG